MAFSPRTSYSSPLNCRSRRIRFGLPDRSWAKARSRSWLVQGPSILAMPMCRALSVAWDLARARRVSKLMLHSLRQTTSSFPLASSMACAKLVVSTMPMAKRWEGCLAFTAATRFLPSREWGQGQACGFGQRSVVTASTRVSGAGAWGPPRDAPGGGTQTRSFSSAPNFLRVNRAPLRSGSAAKAAIAWQRLEVRPTPWTKDLRNMPGALTVPRSRGSDGARAKRWRSCATEASRVGSSPTTPRTTGSFGRGADLALATARLAACTALSLREAMSSGDSRRISTVSSSSQFSPWALS
mmetsp:Transcript_16157/g.47449  ORF Transcript_16157/g.47449 Transcript_16157/m.47449 type:complete len:297 (-) Transcript_16157:294-1184(-)